MKKDPEGKSPKESASDQSHASTPDEPITEQEIALSENQSTVPETGQKPIPAGEGETAAVEDRLAQERELDEKLGNEEE